MLKQKNILLIALLISSFLFSCSNFEDGPKISLLPKTKRLSRTWKIEYSINLVSGVEHSADYAGWLLQFNKDGSYSQTIIYGETQTIYNGKWEFIGDNQIRFEWNTNAGEQIEFYTILRLTKKEFWMKNELEEIHYYAE